jgi:hypothetical protein
MPLEAAILIIGVGAVLLLFTGLSYMLDSGLGALISTILFADPERSVSSMECQAILFLHPAALFGRPLLSQRS